ncbi:MAG: hypothetical protein JKY54_16640, partial [Flavobacteriales bacterium]|nr:hypothetical protein [Flavobacteriales bacterium]
MLHPKVKPVTQKVEQTVKNDQYLSHTTEDISHDLEGEETVAPKDYVSLRSVVDMPNGDDGEDINTDDLADGDKIVKTVGDQGNGENSQDGGKPEGETEQDKEENGIGEKLANLFKQQEEVSPEKQAHLKGEFNVYVNEKLASFVDDEKKQEFTALKDKFLKRMQGHKHDHWGYNKYYRLKEKWFQDYDDVIANKIANIKSTINSAVGVINISITDVISTIQ